MNGRSVLIVPSLIIVFFMISGLAVATQWTASIFDYTPKLGPPLFTVGGVAVYTPTKFLYWWYVYGDYAPEEFKKASLAIHISVLLGLAFSFSMATFRARKKENPTSHGSSKWASKKDIEKSGLLKGEGIILGLTEEGEYLRHDGPEHAITTAPTRSGKGVGNIIPTLFSWPHSVAVTDIKRENWEITAGYRQKHLNNKVLKFEPTADDGSSVKFNPLNEVRLKTKHEVQDVQNIVNMLVDPEGVGKLDNDHWAKTAAALLVGVILHLKYKDENAGLPDVASFLMSPEQGFDETLIDMLVEGHAQVETLAQIYGESFTTHPYVAKCIKAIQRKSSVFKEDLFTTIETCLKHYVKHKRDRNDNVLERVRLKTSKEIEDIGEIVDALLEECKEVICDDSREEATTRKSLLCAAILHRMYKNPEASLSDVLDFLTDPEVSKDQTLGNMMIASHEKIRVFAGFCGEEVTTHPIVARASRNMLNKAEKERSSVLSTAVSCLGLYSDPIIAENIAVSEFRIADLMNFHQPVSLYLVSPPAEIERTLPLFRMIVTQIVDILTQKLEFKDGQQSKSYNYRLLLLLDEFPALGKLKKLEKALAYIAGYGIKAWIIIQELNQLYQVYTDKNSIMGNCHVRLFHTANDIVTQEYISKLLGDKTEVVETHNYSGNRFNMMLSGENTHTQETARRLMTPSEVGQMPMEREIIFVAGQPPIYAHKLRYYEVDSLKTRKGSPPAQSDILRPPPLKTIEKVGENLVKRQDETKGAFIEERSAEEIVDLSPSKREEVPSVEAFRIAIQNNIEDAAKEDDNDADLFDEELMPSNEKPH